ncbi:hypothetical protein EDD86DRAFT_275218, partial [Gorgonomyces haynaldii]
MLSFLVSGVSGRYMLSAQWYSTPEDSCVGLPDVMYGFFLRDENARNPVSSMGDIWPAGYTYQSATSNRAYGTRCWLTLKAPLSKECCAYSLNLVSSKGWAASGTMLANQANPLDQAPVAAIGGTYCAITSANYNNKTNLYGMDKAYYRNHGVCITPDSVICFSNGTLAVYPSPNCGGTPNIYDLTSPKTFNDPAMKSVSGEMVTVKDGFTQFSWTILLPSSVYYPTFRYFSDYMLTFFYASAIVAVLGTLVYYIRLYILSKKLFMLAFVFCQLCWAIFAVTRVFTQVGYYNANSNGTLFLFGMTGSLLTVLLNTSMLFLFLEVTPMVAYIVYTVIALLHYAMTWNNYIRYGSLLLFTPELVFVTQTTNTTWLLFMFFADCIPPIYVMWRISGVTWSELSLAKVWEIVLKTDRVFLTALSLQVLNSILYVIQDRIRNFSEILGHDRIWLAFISVDTAIQAYHSVLNVLLIERMKKTLQRPKNLTNMTTKLGAMTTNKTQGDASIISHKSAVM